MFSAIEEEIFLPLLCPVGCLGSRKVCSYHDILDYLNLTRDNEVYTSTRPVLDHTHPTVVRMDLALYSILAVVSLLLVFQSMCECVRMFVFLHVCVCVCVWIYLSIYHSIFRSIPPFNYLSFLLDYILYRNCKWHTRTL